MPDTGKKNAILRRERHHQNPLFPEDRKPQILRIEKNLNTIGVFTPRHQRPPELTKVIKTTVRLADGQRMEATVHVRGSEDCGLPTTPDQDKFYAFTKIIEDIRQAEGGIRNPIRFNYAEMIRLLGRVRGGAVHREIDEWLDRMTSTTIKSTGAIWRAARKRYVSDTFHVFDRAVKVGEELDSGEKAEQNYVWVSSWLLENFEANYVLPIDYEIYRRMKVPIAKALVPLIQVWFYASRHTRNPTIQKRFRELAELLGTRPYSHKSKIEEKMGPGLDELKHHGLIRFWEFQPTSDGKDFKLVLAPGDRFIPERKADLASSPNSPQAKEFTDLLNLLVAHQVREEAARDILFASKDLSFLRLRLQYAEDVINRRKHGRNRIKNEAGFIIYFLENEGPVPEEFTERAVATERAQEFKLKSEYAQFCHKQIWQYFERLSEDERKYRLEEARGTLKKDDVWTYLGEQNLEIMTRDEVVKGLEPEVDLISFEQFCRIERQRQSPLDFA